MSKQICKVSVRQLYGDPQTIGYCYEGEQVADILRLNSKYRIKGMPMFMIEAIPPVDVDFAIEIAEIGEEYDEIPAN